MPAARRRSKQQPLRWENPRNGQTNPLTWSMKQTKCLQKEETSKREARAFGNKAPTNDKARSRTARRQMLKTETLTTFWFVKGAIATACFIKSAKWGPIGPSSPRLIRRSPRAHCIWIRTSGAQRGRKEHGRPEGPPVQYYKYNCLCCTQPKWTRFLGAGTGALSVIAVLDLCVCTRMTGGRPRCPI